MVLFFPMAQISLAVYLYKTIATTILYFSMKIIVKKSPFKYVINVIILPSAGSMKRCAVDPFSEKVPVSKLNCIN